ncbi:MAG: permease [Candidatus Liberibacter europaeus]|uniref:Permease n=1 Tax=Candidatus Liberibacter europaeus TaxID=744859 RepID=A0A2T4VXQ8_9HYPH|nr:permease [Candidatus Liberibacter europaeus]PTL86562.1 MAG: permease [Candidatus Liberibacter europaeus]
MLLGILWRYFFRYYIKITLYFLSGIIAIIFIIDLDEINTQMNVLPGYNTYEGILLVLTRIPLIIQQTIPFITLIISIGVFFNINKKNELVITRAIGVSIWQFLSPFIIGSFLLGMCVILIINPIVVYGNKIGSSLIDKWRNTQQHINVIPWIKVKDINKDLYIGASEISKKEKTLKDAIIITVNNDNNSVMRQEADLAIIDNKSIILKQVKEYKYRSPLILRDSLTLENPIGTNIFDQFDEKFKSFSFYQQIKKIISSHDLSIFNGNTSETKFYFLITTPFMLIAMTLMAAAVSLKFDRVGQSRTIVTYGILSGFILYTTTTLMKSLGTSGILIPFAAASIPIISTISISILILLQNEDG